MASLFIKLGITCLALITLNTHAQTLTLTSPSHQVNMIELYSSQGCSSCPPAERWLGKFKNDQRLWKDIVPINFHVDYWDYLGWKDPFANPEFSQRQRFYALLGRSNVVATPGFFLNGSGWKGWFRGQPLPLQKKPAPLNINASINNELATININPVNLKELELHIAILGFDIKTPIKTGENHNKTLVDNFVVLAHTRKEIDGPQTRMQLPTVDTKFKNTKKAIVIWAATKGDLAPVQTVGGWL